MNKQIAKHVLLAAWLLACLTLFCGCVEQLSERPMEDLTANEIVTDTAVPVRDGTQELEIPMTLYFLGENGTTLYPVVRSVLVEDGTTRAQAAVNALLRGPLENEGGAQWPDIGGARSGRFVELSGGIATVDLPAKARTLSQEMLYAVRMAIASTLMEFPEISYVNVLIGGREEGLDLGATLPVGTFTRVESLDAGARYSRLQEQRLSASGVSLLTTLYFPSKDGAMILPQVRSMAYAEISPIEYLYMLLDELGRGTGHDLCVESVPAPLDYIVEMPEIVRTEDGYVAIELRFSDMLLDDLAACDLTLGVYMAMLTDTLMGFVPGVEGLKVSVGEREITGLEAGETPNGQPYEFVQTLATREDFAGYVGTPQTLYVMNETGGLRRVSRPVEQSASGSARARLQALMRLGEEEFFALPEGVTDEDILAAYVYEEEITLNLSGAFADALAALTKEEERAVVYAMVNTLTEDMQVSRVVFFFEGKQRETLAGALDMRGAFVRNPGMVVN